MAPSPIQRGGISFIFGILLLTEWRENSTLVSSEGEACGQGYRVSLPVNAPQRSLPESSGMTEARRIVRCLRLA